MFNGDTDQYTILTSNKSFNFESNTYQPNPGAHPLQQHPQWLHLHQFQWSLQKYAGIPISCHQCEKDLSQHELLHFLPHQKCKFCRWHMKHFTRKIDKLYPDSDLSLRITLCQSIPCGQGTDTNRDLCVKKMELLNLFEKMRSEEDATCSVCYKLCINKDSRVQHEQRCHQASTYSIKCIDCNLSFKSKSALQYHMRTKHTIPKNYNCDQCEFQCATRQSLVRHIQAKHSNRLKCDECEQTFSRKDSLRKHEQDVHLIATKNLEFTTVLVRPFCCEICPSSFKRKSALKRHSDNCHSNTCPHCSKAFSSKDNCMAHEKNCKQKI